VLILQCPTHHLNVPDWFRDSPLIIVLTLVCLNFQSMYVISIQNGVIKLSSCDGLFLIYNTRV
jgi:hypothetical protein